MKLVLSGSEGEEYEAEVFPKRSLLSEVLRSLTKVSFLNIIKRMFWSKPVKQKINVIHHQSQKKC